MKKKISKARRRIDADGVLTAFVQEHEQRFIEIAYRFTRDMDDARDLVQDSLLRACERYHQFDGHNLGGWLRVIIRNSWIEHARRMKRQEAVRHLIERGPRANGATQDRAELCIVLQDVLQLLRALPRYQRRAITAISTGSKYHEVARKHGISEGSVKSAVSRARTSLMLAM
jgi:RNA polymerase sigma-70 factor (ECF subfamily)